MVKTLMIAWPYVFRGKYKITGSIAFLQHHLSALETLRNDGDKDALPTLVNSQASVRLDSKKWDIWKKTARMARTQIYYYLGTSGFTKMADERQKKSMITVLSAL